MTPTHLAIVMEYAAGGELFERICSAGRFSEDEVGLYVSFDMQWSVSWHIEHLNCSFMSLMAGKIFLPAANIWSQLLSFHGMFLSFSYFVSVYMRSLHSCSYRNP